MPPRKRPTNDDESTTQQGPTDPVGTSNSESASNGGTASSKRPRKAVDRLIDSISLPGSAASSSNNTFLKSRTNVSSVKVTIHDETQPIPKRNANGELVFPDFPDFKPNLSPKEVLQMGSFGGTYFRVITSGVTGETYRDAWKEFPDDWFEGLSIKKQVSSSYYDIGVNKYKESCGGDLAMWEGNGWITHIDPFGWFQWYCRFYLGRRSSDDERQVGRGLGVMGAKGRWRNNLVNKCLSTGLLPEQAVNNSAIAPKVRQLLQHWGYQLTLRDLQQAAKGKK